MKACIHQPQFIPYLGFFNKIAQCDVYVVLDDIKATSNDFTNRNRLKSSNGLYWLTIPVKSKNVIIKEMEISDNISWQSKHLKSFMQYGGCQYFESYYSDIEKIYNKKHLKSILEIDLEFLKWLFDILNINIDVVYSSDLEIAYKKTQRLVDICNYIGATTYVSGIGGKQYLDHTLFEKDKIMLNFQDFKHPIYKQKFKGFVPNLSIIDALFNCGEVQLMKLISNDENIKRITP